MGYNQELSYVIHFDHSDKSWDEIGKVHNQMADLVESAGLKIVDMPAGGWVGDPHRDIGIVTDKAPSEELKKEVHNLLNAKFKILTEEELKKYLADI